MSLTAIVPAFNEEKSLAATVTSLLQQTYPLSRIVIVDDCSADGTYLLATQLAEKYPGIDVIQTPKNTGTKARAQNYALNTVDTELFVSIDGDTTLAPDAIEKAMPYFNDPETFAVCGFVVPQRIRSMWERGRLIDYLFGMSLMKPAQNHQGVVLVASGCFTIFSTEVVNRLGGFNERTLAEDMDLTWEGIGAGYRVYFASNALCHAVDPPTAKIYVRQMERWFRGLAQNISVRGFNVFKTSGSLGALVYVYLITSVLGLFGTPILLWYWISNFPVAIALSFVIELTLIALFALPRAARLGMFKTAVASIPAMFVTTYVNRGVFLYSMFVELVLGRRLSSWHKGH